MITENLSTLKIHKLTQAQYERELEAGRIDENALYLTPDEELDFYVGSFSGVNKDSGSKKLIAAPSDAVTGDLLTYNGTNWVRISRADLIAEIIAALPRAEEATF